MKEVTPCPEWEKQLSCTHPEDLSSVEQIALMAHVARCAAWARARAHYLETDDLLRSLPPIEPLRSLPTLIQHRGKGKDGRVVYSRFPVSVTTRTAARHTDLREQPYISEALNSRVVTPSTTEVSDQAGQTSSRPLQKQLLPDRCSRKRSLVPVLVALLLIVATGASLWGFAATGRNYVATPTPTGHPTAVATAPVTSSPYPQLAASYSGTIYDLLENDPSPMTLTRMRQSGERISGSFSALHQTGMYTGLLSTSRSIDFIVAGSGSRAPLHFWGSVGVDGTLGGSFCARDQTGQCLPYGAFGLWRVAPPVGR
jgi:hypothetical protein